MHERTSAAAIALSAYERGDAATILELLADRPLELWFGLRPADTQTVLGSLPADARQPNSAAAIVLSAFTPLGISGQLANPATRSAALSDERLRPWVLFAEACQARMRGEVAEAYELMRPLQDSIPAQTLIDRSRGLHTFFSTQLALTALLDGDVTAALAHYQRSLQTLPPPELGFLTREAHLRSGLVHALFGDPGLAGAHLELARAVPRTTSWPEHLLDGDERLLEALLLPVERAEEAADIAFALSLAPEVMEELWPLYVIAVQRLGVVASRPGATRDRLAAMRTARSLGPARTAAPRGLADSVFALTFGLDELLRGRPSRAGAEFARADPALWQTRLLLALHAALTNSPKRALALARGTRTSTRGLPVVDHLRLAATAYASLSLGDTEEAKAVFALIADKLIPGEWSYFAAIAPKLTRLAHAPTPQAAPLPHLTARELEVLNGLAHQLTRSEIAAQLQLSENTVKSHQRSLYRKLGVGTASAAVSEAVARGVV